MICTDPTDALIMYPFGCQATARESSRERVTREVESQKLRSLQLELLQAAGGAIWTQGEVDRLRPLAESRVTSAREFWQRELELKTLAQQVSSLKRRLSLVGLPADEIDRLCTGEVEHP